MANDMALSPDKIEVGVRKRPLNQEAVERLKASFQKIGQQQPVSVFSFKESDMWYLVAGLHRLEAARQLGIDVLAVQVHLDETDRELWEIDENFCRAELTQQQFDLQMKRRKELYLQKHPETAAGAAQGIGKLKSLGKDLGDKLSPKSFAEDASEKIGVEKRTVQRAVQRAEAIPDDVHERIAQLPTVSDSGVEMSALAKLPPEQQREVVSAVERGEAKSVREAVAQSAEEPTSTEGGKTKWNAATVALWASTAKAATATPKQPSDVDRELDELLNQMFGPRHIPKGKRAADAERLRLECRNYRLQDVEKNPPADVVALVLVGFDNDACLEPIARALAKAGYGHFALDVIKAAQPFIADA